MYADAQEAEQGAASGRVDARFVDLAVEVLQRAGRADEGAGSCCPCAAGELPVNAIAAAVGRQGAGRRCRSISRSSGWPGSWRRDRRGTGCSTGWRTSTPPSWSPTPSTRRSTPSGQPRHHRDPTSARAPHRPAATGRGRTHEHHHTATITTTAMITSTTTTMITTMIKQAALGAS